MIDKNTIYSYFQTDDFPTEEQFRATWDSFWHKSDSIPMSSITGLNQLFQQTATVAQLNDKANVDGSNIDVSAYQEKLNITNLIATAKEEVKTELLNGAPEAFDTLKEISDWISDDETAEAAILQAIQNEATARTEADNQKLDKGSYVGTAQDLYNHIEGKIDAGYNCIPVVGNGASGKVLTDSVVSQIYGKLGIGLPGEATEKLEVNGNIKADNLKAKSTQFQLQSSINPTPNTLVPKTDGSGLIWIDNNSVQHAVALKDDIQDNLICEVVFNGRQELYFSSFDYSTGIGVTTSPHGLTIGQIIQCSVVPNSFKTLGKDHSKYPTLYSDMRNIPYEFYQNMLKIYVIDANTVEVRNWSEATITVNTTSTQNNGYMLPSNFTWHIELKQGSSISTPNFPINIKNCRIDMLSMGDMDFSGSEYRFIYFKLYNTSGISFTPTNIGSFIPYNGSSAGYLGNFIWDKLTAGLSVTQAIYARSIIDIHADTSLATVSIREKRYGRGTSAFALSEVKFDNIVDIPMPDNKGIASLIFYYGQKGRYANGTTLRIYKK